MCNIAGLHASPKGLWVAVKVGCGASVHTRIMAAATGEVNPLEVGESFFLSWAPDGNSYLLRAGNLGESAVLLVSARDGRLEQMDTPEFTYDAAFSPDGARVLYAVTRGLGFGSELWIVDRDGRNREQIISDPSHVIAFPRWSPTEEAIVFIRMVDSNVPFTVGELVLADGNGHNERVIASADAGHGYAPTWSPNGNQVAFVVRENPEDRSADVATQYLTSNIYVADVASGNVRPVTRFDSALTNGPSWSPDGGWLAYSTNANGGTDVWLVEVASGETQQVTQNADAYHPVWLAGST
jgi:Tol biopolymer transport system component